VFALAVLAGVLIHQRQGVPRTARLWGQLVLQGMMSTALPWILITWAERYIESAMATVLNGTVPLFTIVVAHHALSDDKMTRRRIGGLLVGFFGVLVLVHTDLRVLGAGDTAVRMVVLGQLAMLASSFFYGVSNVYARAKFRGMSPVFQSFYTMLAAAAIMWMVTPVVEAPLALPKLPLTWTAIAWLGLLGAGVSYLMFYHLLHQIGPTRMATVTYTIPVVGVTLGVLFLDEALTWELVAGTILIVSGVVSVTRR
jgi:drug/metabolite transporter (DMT)-like permease